MVPEMRRIIIGVDPATTSGDNADMTGIVIVGLMADGRGCVLADISCRETPDTWARIVNKAYLEYAADRVVCETNAGGDLLEALLRTVNPRISYKGVHARRGKYTRAEPVAALYEQDKIVHLKHFPELEDQMCSYTPDNFVGSPDRVDALVWAVTELMLHEPVSIDGEIVTGHRRGAQPIDEPDETAQDDDEWDND